MRAYVVGSSGAGKTTMSRALSQRLGVPHVELDSIFHQPGWTPLPDDEFRARVSQAIAAQGWVVDGNYGAVRPLVLDRATTVVWLDYERWFVMQRVIRRSVARAFDRRELWNGNREDWRAWVRPSHPIRWSWSQHHRKREEYAERFTSPDHAHLEVIRLRTPGEAKRWLSTIP